MQNISDTYFLGTCCFSYRKIYASCNKPPEMLVAPALQQLILTLLKLGGCTELKPAPAQGSGQSSWDHASLCLWPNGRGGSIQHSR